jgi:hypothetical protein
MDQRWRQATMSQGGSAAHRGDRVIGAAAGVAGPHEFVASAACVIMASIGTAALATFQLVAS